MNTLVLCFLCSFGVPSANAAPAATSVSFAHGVSVSVPILNGTPGAPPVLSEGVRVGHPFTNGWSWMEEAGMSTPTTAFAPSVYVTTGPAFVLHGNALLGEGVTFKWSPETDATPSTIALGLAVAPLFRVSFGSLTLPVGVSCTVTDPMVCSASFGAKLLIKLNE